jgi:hypothetical protein
MGTETTEDGVSEQLRGHYNTTADYGHRVEREYEGPDLDLELNIAKAFKKATLFDAREHYESNKLVLQTLAIKEDKRRTIAKS